MIFQKKGNRLHICQGIGKWYEDGSFTKWCACLVSLGFERLDSP